MEKQGTEKYFTLDKQEEQKFILSQNRQVLIDIRNDDIAFYTQEVAIPAALVHLKWQTEEAATLMISRRLAEQQYKTKTVPVLPLSEMNTGAAEETSPDSSPEGV